MSQVIMAGVVRTLMEYITDYARDLIRSGIMPHNIGCNLWGDF